MQVDNLGGSRWWVLVVLAMSVTSAVRAQDSPEVPMVCTPVASPAEAAATQEASEAALGAPPASLVLPRHPHRGRRLVRTGGTLFGLGILGMAVGAAAGASSYESCADSEDYCISFGPGLAALAAAMTMSPLVISGVIMMARGARLNARQRRAVPSLQVSHRHLQLRLVGRF
ncbi:MAG: hypothetical protein R3B40_26930 [Polyangiales bacterium]